LCGFIPPLAQLSEGKLPKAQHIVRGEHAVDPTAPTRPNFDHVDILLYRGVIC
jgi:hypothetical protein